MGGDGERRRATLRRCGAPRTYSPRERTLVRSAGPYSVGGASGPEATEHAPRAWLLLHPGLRPSSTSGLMYSGVPTLGDVGLQAGSHRVTGWSHRVAGWAIQGCRAHVQRGAHLRHG